MSKENFMQDISWLSNLKLRGSYGILGNLGDFSTGSESVNDKDNNIILDRILQNIAYYATTRPNPNLKWGNLNKPTLV